ncbi:junction-mediating and -regulatory protein-like [Takifugu flavidus]|uniref:Junction-mediating and-regulatory protein n=1 Tax=Takifugu flavidus TaxID=433684 RepID=A0A5C6MYL4_9TELE|nr:junction-mediating and -regulatory protein-like [Takifugu flavidus]TWW60073.1 Junction-mediating and -regulatory protein [Takifugu flavidus]
MSFAMEDNLELGWVAVRPNAFEEKERHKFVFIVAWNEVEGKFAITCHNRTVQRRSLVREPLVLDVDKTKCPDSPIRDKVSKSPGRGVRDAETKGCSSSIKSASATSKKPSKSPASPLSPDIEVLKPLFDDQPSPSLDSLDLEELDSLSREDCSWAGLFSFQDLRAVHQQLCSVNSDLEPCLPAFPEEPAGMWTVLFGPAEVTETEMDELCHRLQVYLGHALDTCSWKILSQVLFTENDDPDEYYESLSELRQSGHEEALNRATWHLHELLEKHKTTDSMVELLQLYEEEDQAYGGLLEASTQLYQYLLQPFRDMRELAMLRRQQIKISLENDYLGPRRIETLKKEDFDWQKKAQEAVLNIQEFTVKYFEITAKAQKGVYERMKVDQRKFGKSSWTAAVERMERLRYSVAKETLQLQRAREICLDQRKHALREQMQSLCSSEDAMALLDLMESQYYELQLQLYDIQAEILQCEELLLAAQLDSIHRQILERQDEVVYYDTFESSDDITEEDAEEREELRRLQAGARQLEARRGRIIAKRSYLRNKKEVCVSNHTQKEQKRQSVHQGSISQQLLQMKNEEEDEARKNSRVSQERQRTLDRLRTFKQRYPGQVILKSTRLRSSHTRRRDHGRSVQIGGATEDCVDAAGVQLQGPPLCLSTSVQTEPSTTLTTQPVTSRTASLPPLPVPSPADSSCSPCSLSSLLGSPISPPPPPPPPPPLPIKEDVSPATKPPQWGKKGERKNASGDVPLSPLGPFIPRFFDSSQLVSARKKLRKTPEFDSSSRRVSSPMDEVLASLKRGSFHLRKVEQRALPPAKGDDDPNSILVQIRKGVKLRRVPRKEKKDHAELLTSADALTRSIHEALRRIKEASPESDSEDEGLAGPDWDS